MQLIDSTGKNLTHVSTYKPHFLRKEKMSKKGLFLAFFEILIFFTFMSAIPAAEAYKISNYFYAWYKKDVFFAKVRK